MDKDAYIDFDKVSLDNPYWKDTCGHYVHCTQEFCFKCLNEEEKWRLGVL